MRITYAIVGMILVAMGCGDDGNATHHDAGVDTAPLIDALPDAPACVPLAQPTCGSTTAPTTPASNGNTTCNPLTQAGCATGEKCTWIVDQTSPSTVGHIGCTPDGTVNTGCACTYGAAGTTGYDDCAKGNVCNAGKCKQICDNQGGTPACDADHACTTYANLFSTGSTTPAAAGVCDVACNPLTENNFQGGPGAGCRCGSAQGCYGYPSFGTPPVTAFTCTTVLGSSSTLVHRSPLPSGTVFVNSCAPGYLPLLRESTMSATVICVALCKPVNCYAGNCGASDANRLGAAPHRCMNPDARGTFDTSADGEHCAFLWFQEVDSSNGTLLKSPYSDEVGYCFDHSKYLYDTNGDGSADAPLPPCKDLADGFGSGSAFGAADLGCVDTTHAPPAAHVPGQPRLPDLRPFYGIMAK